VMEVPPFTELPIAHPDPLEAEGACFECSLNTAGDGMPPSAPPTA
jgi:hypothetical protein